MNSIIRHELSPTPHRKQNIVEGLNNALTVALGLYWQVQQTHLSRNASAPEKSQLFGHFARRLSAVVDLFAERVVALGGVPRKDMPFDALTAELGDVTGDVQNAAHLEALVDLYAAYAKLLRKRIAQAHQWHDALTERLYHDALRCAETDTRELEKQLIQMTSGRPAHENPLGDPSEIH